MHAPACSHETHSSAHSMAPHVPPKTLPASVAFAADTSLRNLARSPEARSPDVRSPDAKSPMSSPLPPSLPLPASVVEALEPPPSASASAMATSSTSRGLTPSMPGSRMRTVISN